MATLLGTGALLFAAIQNSAYRLPAQAVGRLAACHA
jgi:hypothetical protein